MSFLELVHTPEAPPKATKSELEFNKALKEQEELELLRTTYESISLKINAIVGEIDAKYYSETILLEKEILELLISHFENKSLKGGTFQKRVLKSLIFEKLDKMKSIDYSFYLQNYMKMLSPTERMRIENSKLKIEREIEDELGFEFSFEDFDSFDFRTADTDSETYKNYKKAQDFFYSRSQDFQDEQFEFEKEKKKPKKKEDATTMSISKLFREIALKIHPDREQNEEKRRIKESLMKRLTEARNKNNLYEMFAIALEAKKNQFLATLHTIVDTKVFSKFTKMVKEENLKLIHQIHHLQDEIQMHFETRTRIDKLNDKKLTLYKNKLETQKKKEMDELIGLRNSLKNSPKAFLEDLIYEAYFS